MNIIAVFLFGCIFCIGWLIVKAQPHYDEDPEDDPYKDKDNFGGW